MIKIVFFLIFFLGVCLGSFLNCLIYRLKEGVSFLKGRSYCPRCRHPLGPKDLIPILSFFLLGGKCRYCREKISWQYPIIELATGFLFVFSSRFIFLNPEIFPCSLLYCYLAILFYWFFISVLIVIFVYDLKYYIIPDKVIYPAMGLAFLWRGLEVLKFANCNLFGVWDSAPETLFWYGTGLEFGIWRPFLVSVLAAFLASTFFLVIVLISKGKWMGLGDAKMAFFMGLLLGLPNVLVALFIAFFFGALIGIGLIILKKKSLKSEIPFGPFLASGTLISLFWGRQILNFYLNLF